MRSRSLGLAGIACPAPTVCAAVGTRYYTAADPELDYQSSRMLWCNSLVSDFSVLSSG